MNKKEVVDCETQETAPRYMSVGNIFIRSNVPNVTMISHDIIRLRWINGGSAELARVTITANTSTGWLPLYDSHYHHRR